ncbi:hypothetical protein SLS56_003044 [Neofusicoccum ribis]|uniref:Heterokaryon incompatibility domain-containing protein n=1 Tax=Neofusicoccum ribis TaxID=45134 RepID=A0ABR3T250_9PEZI
MRAPASRLLDVQAFPPPCLDVRLVETRLEQDTSKYTALSHRWGTTATPFTTTCATLPDRAARIPLAALPRTFRHAVRATRALGPRYLWIDSLCIVQDSADDWAAESGRMGAIYARSHVTLAADCSGSSDGGLFSEASAVPDEEHIALDVLEAGDEGRARWCRLHVSLEREVPPNLVAMGTAGEEDGDGEEDVDRMLVTRGWTLQEAVLAPRVLHYTSKELVWECARLGYVAVDGFSVHLRYTRPTYTEVKERLRVKGEEGKGDAEEAMAVVRDKGGRKLTPEKLNVLIAWYFDLILLRYATRNLTFQKDRLPAIAGLAAWTSEALQCEYIAGMWRAGLEWALTWRKERPEKSIRQSGTDDRNIAAADATAGAELVKATSAISRNSAEASIRHHAPSFSWASTTGQIQWDYAISTFIPTLSISDVNLQLVDPSPFGQVYAGLDSGTWLRVEGWVTRSIVLRRKRGTPAFMLPGGALCTVWLDSEREEEHDEDMRVALLELGVAAGPSEAAGGGQWWVDEGRPRNVCLLVLEEVKWATEAGSFVRKGMVEFDWDPRVLKEFRKELRWETITLF